MNFNPQKINQLTLLNHQDYNNYDLSKSYKYCQTIATKHYENFVVASIFIPKNQRKYFHSVYAFSRLADDIADEKIIETKQKKIELLDQLNTALLQLTSVTTINTPILLALQDTINRNNLPIELFQRLLKAFKQDVQFEQPENYQNIIDYCHQSANPIGEIILRIFNEHTPQNIELSNKICTGLQLINFWQDLSIDLQNGRCYLPQELLEKYNIKYNYKLIGSNNNINNMLKEIYDFTIKIYTDGQKLTENLNNNKLKAEINFIYNSGYKILKKIIHLENNILFIRPKLTKFEFLKLLYKIYFLRNGTDHTE